MAPLVTPPMSDLLPVAPTGETERLAVAVAAWLDAKQRRTGSQRTYRAYHDTLLSFCAALRVANLSLLSDPAQVALVAQAWCGAGEAAATTANQRLAIVSSFYQFLSARGLFDLPNPITRVERRPVQAYAASAALDPAEVGQRLAAIDRSTTDGQRDYCLLAVALTTGRRLSEVGGLTWGDVAVAGGAVTLTFRRAKGGKQLRDTLARQLSTDLLGYLSARYGPLRQLDPATSLWGMGVRAMQTMCGRRLGTTRFHRLRHTFAHQLELAGAKASEIQARLGHSSLATTGIYLAALRREENPYAEDLAARFGL